MHLHCLRGLAAQAGIQLRATKTEISAALWGSCGLGRLYIFTKQCEAQNLLQLLGDMPHM